MSQRRLLSSVALVAIALIAACSDSTTQPGDGDLSAEQLQSMTSALSFLFGVSVGHAEASRALPTQLNSQRVLAETIPLFSPTSCPQGGRVGASGSFSTDSAGDGTFALTDTLVDCAIKDNHSNVWTFNSQPTVEVTLEELSNIHGDTIDLAHSTLIQTDVGTVRYSTGGLSGTCSLNLAIRLDVARGSPTPDSATYTISTVGLVCGHQVARDTSSTLPYTPPQL